MNPFVSWAIFIAVVGGFYYISQRKQTTLKKIVDSKAVQNSKSIFLSAGSGAETGGDSKKKAQPKKKRKAALSNTTQSKELVSTDEAASDDDVAQEVDSADVAKRLQAMKEGSDGKLTPSSNTRGSRQLAAPHSPFATASQTSSTGADADIDEEEGTQLPESEYPSLPKSSSTDPSDMLEEPTGGPGVLRVIPSAQPPRLQKKKKSSNAVETGVHANKNSKKKEKKKADKDAARAEQTAAFERHRAAQRAAEAAQAKSKPVQATPPPPSRWTNTNGPSTAPAAQAPVELAAPTTNTTSSDMLDTFVPGSQSSSHDSEEERRNLRSTTLGDSMWEAIPSYISGPEPEWNEVKGRKSRKDRKPAPASASGDEVRKPAGRPSGGNNFNVLEQSGESVTGSDAKTTDSEAWAEMDWAVDHSSS